MSDKRRKSLYFPEPLRVRMQAQADRLGRSLSWIVQNCVMHSIDRIEKLPAQDMESEE